MKVFLDVLAWSIVSLPFLFIIFTMVVNKELRDTMIFILFAVCALIALTWAAAHVGTL